MKVRAIEREFNIFEIFCHDDEMSSTRPFDGWEMARVLNEKAEELYPDRYVWFVCPDESGLGQWNVRFNKDRHDYGDGLGDVRFKTYPMPRVYDERAFRRLLPAELDEVLLELNKLDFEL
jgi:hypothetical protein